jgi:hypothetical protein
VIVLGIDGGNRKANGRVCYVAEADGGTLQRVFTANREDAVLAVRRGDIVADRVAVERPKYDGRIDRGVPPGVIIDLAWNVGRVAEALAHGAQVVEYTSDDWIGGVTKPVLHGRIWNALTPAERQLFPADTAEKLHEAKLRKATNPKARPFEHHSYNTLDAVGVLFIDLGRIGKGGTKR